MQFLLRSLIELPQDEDDEVVEMTLSVLHKVLLATGIPTASHITLQLAERLRPLFDNVRLCAPPTTSAGCCQETLCPVDFQTRAQVGLEQPVMRSCPLPFHQDANNVRLLSIHLFRHVMELVVDVGKQPLKTHVQQSLLPLLCHLHDENQRVAEVRIADLLVSPWEVARLPPALAPHGLQCPSLLSWPWLESSSSGGPLSCCPGSIRCPRWGLSHSSARAPNLPTDTFPSCCLFPPGARKGPEPCPGAGDAGPVPWAAVPSPSLCCSAGLSENPA